MLLLEGVGDVLGEDEAEDDVLILGGVHRAAQRVGQLPELGFVSNGGGASGSCRVLRQRCHRIAFKCFMKRPKSRCNWDEWSVSRFTQSPLTLFKALSRFLINSLYGYLAFPFGHFADFDAAERVTAIGQEILATMRDWLDFSRALKSSNSTHQRHLF